MPDAERVLRALREATIHSRATRGRKGTVVEISDADDVLVAGDLHGNLENFRQLVRLADLDTHPLRHLVLQEFVHGTGRYPQGGCTSHRLVDLVAVLKCRYPHRVHLVIGNHELAELTGRPIAKGGESMLELFEAGVESGYGEYAEQVLDAYDELFDAFPLAVRTANRVFISHSIPPGAVLDRFDLEIFDVPSVHEDERGKGSSFHHLVWGRDVSEETSRRFAQMVDADLLVTGHIAQPEGFAIPNDRQVIVDCVDVPAACVLIPTDEPLTHSRLVENIVLLPGD